MTVYNIHYRGAVYPCRDDETLLEAMLRQGVAFPFSCRKGICHVCMHRVESGELPAGAQQGLSASQVAAGWFLPCRCRPTGDLSIAPKDAADDGSKALPPADDTRFQPDEEMWAALGEGVLLNRILKEFYGMVYEDERLSAFFHNVTQQRAIEKQYLFLRQIFTGEKVYFGDRPRNAHHWMVISDELFDYRERLMLGCLRRNGLPEHLVRRWRMIEEAFRGDIVKDTPWKRKMGDVELPVEGYGELVLEVGSLCDGCGREVNAGETVRYHLRLGQIYCPRCMQGGRAD